VPLTDRGGLQESSFCWDLKGRLERGGKSVLLLILGGKEGSESEWEGKKRGNFHPHEDRKLKTRRSREKGVTPVGESGVGKRISWH